jgi:phosphohistidine phosphatase
MKELIIIRHAKASDDYFTIPDFDRPLKSRGISQAYEMSKNLGQKGGKPDLVITSPAARALHTAYIFAATLHYPYEKIRLEKSMFEAYVEHLLTIFDTVDDAHHQVLLIGHNPSLTHLSNYLLDSHINEIPTCGIVSIHLEVESWKDMSQNKHQLSFIDFPLKKIIDKSIADEKSDKLNDNKKIDDATKI